MPETACDVDYVEFKESNNVMLRIQIIHLVEEGKEANDRRDPFRSFIAVRAC